MENVFCAHAPAKIILFGEHSVVYGKTAVAMAINLRSLVVYHPFRSSMNLIIRSQKLGIEKAPLADIYYGNYKTERYMDIVTSYLRVFEEKYEDLKPLHGGQLDIYSDIPVGAGLGSSASVNVSTVGAMLRYLFPNDPLDPARVSKFARYGEMVNHGNPSGIDDTTISMGGVIVKKETSQSHFKIDNLELHLVIADTQVPRSTKALVKKVARYFKNYPDRKDDILAAMNDIANQGVIALHSNDIKHIGELMNENQSYLKKLGVSHDKLELFIKTSLDMGALGAKLTGAGGGGAMIALAIDANHARKIQEKLTSLGGNAMYTQFTNQGVTKC